MAVAFAAGPAAAEELSDLEKAYLGWTKSPEEIRALREAPGDRERLRDDAAHWAESVQAGGSPTETPTPKRHAPRCMYGASGELIHAPPGADCGPTGRRGEAPRSEDFAVPRVDPAAGWAPVRAGEELLYALVARRSIAQGTGPAETLVRSGSYHVAVVGDSGGGPLEMLSAYRMRRDAEALEEIERGSLTVVPSRGSYRIQALRTHLLGSTVRVRLSTPVDFLPARIARGVRWNAGEFSVKGLHYREEGEIVGLQSARTPAGVFEQCLVVQHTGTLSGDIVAGGALLEIAEGRVERIQWLARGIGPVLVKQKAYTEIDVRGGDRVTTQVARQIALQGVRRPSAGAPASER